MKKLILNEKQYNRLQNIIIDKAIISEQTKSQIMIIQQRLKECFSAYLGTSGPNRDGVDGVAGNKTKTAIETYTKYRFDQGDSGTQGTSAIQNPIPINNKISADLYYKIIAN